MVMMNVRPGRRARHRPGGPALHVASRGWWEGWDG